MIEAPDVRERFAQLNLEPVGGTPEEFARFLKDYFEQGIEPRGWAGAKFDEFYKSEVVRWVKVARDAGIKPE